MEVIEIPIASNAAHFTQQNEIFKKSFFLEFEWIENQEFWLLYISDDQHSPLQSGIKLQNNWPLYVYKEGDERIILSLLTAMGNKRLTRLNLKDCTLVAHVPAL